MARGYRDIPEPDVKVEEPVGEQRVEPKAEVNQSMNNGQSPLVLVSENDAYIHELMKSQPKTIEEVETRVERDYDSPKGILALPEPLEKYSSKYAFRWISKKKRAIDHAISTVGWSFVNRLLFPDLPKYLFTANGSIERGDAILTFIPLNIAEKIRLRPAQLSRERVKNLPVQDLRNWKDTGNENHYKPDLGAAENDNEKPRGISITPDTDITETEQ